MTWPSQKSEPKRGEKTRKDTRFEGGGWPLGSHRGRFLEEMGSWLCLGSRIYIISVLQSFVVVLIKFCENNF